LLEAAVEVRGAAAQQLAMAAEVLGDAALPDLYGQNCLVKVAVSTSFFAIEQETQRFHETSCPGRRLTGTYVRVWRSPRS
jgi:predicted phosphoribosyltransferase